MSESLVGRAVASTRQTAGSVIAALAGGGVSGPAAMAVDDLIVIPGIVSAARFAHDVPLDAADTIDSTSNGVIARTTARPMEREPFRRASRRRVMGMPPQARVLYGEPTTRARE